MMLMSLMIIMPAQSQEFKKAIENDANIKIMKLVNDLKITAYNGNELIIETSDYEFNKPERADGLRSLYNSHGDNTGVGLYIGKEGDSYWIMPATKQAEDATYAIKVPANINLNIDYQHPYAEDVTIDGVKGDIAVSVLNGDINMTGVTGAVNIYSISGDVNIDFEKINQDAPSVINCINGEMDLKIPETTTADFTLSSMHGDVFTDLDIKMKRDEKADNLTRIGGNIYNGTLNGGGVELKFTTVNQNIYLRKK